MKAVLFGLNSALRIIDLCHEIDRHHLLSAGYVLYTAWDYLPAATVFCAVVDPGVGSDRGFLLAQVDSKILIAPDNGLISLLHRLKPGLQVFELKTQTLQASLLSPGLSGGRDRSGRDRGPGGTFHGRDIFAPAAAACAGGETEAVKGRTLKPVLLPGARPRIDPGTGLVLGRVLHVDHFGNCISSIHRSDLGPAPPANASFETVSGRGRTVAVSTAAVATPGIATSRVPTGAVAPARFQAARIQAGGQLLQGIKGTYADVEGGRALCLFGSAGFLEIAVREGSAARELGLTLDDEIIITPSE